MLFGIIQFYVKYRNLPFEVFYLGDFRNGHISVTRMGETRWIGLHLTAPFDILRVSLTLS
jgi:hypothetical protein